MALPEFIKVENGHEMDIFPVFDEKQNPEEIVFWCHSCDPEGSGITSATLYDHTAKDAYFLLAEYGALHAEGPVDNAST